MLQINAFAKHNMKKRDENKSLLLHETMCVC